MWAIHTTLYRVCCIEYTWLFVNAQCYAVLCISHSKCIFFLAFKQFDSTKPIQLLKTYGQFTPHCIMYVVLNTLGCLWTLNAMMYCVFRIPNVFFFLAFKEFDNTKPIQLEKAYAGNSHHIVSCMLYWIHLVVCERSMLCCIVYFAFQMYIFFGIQTIW